MVFIKNQDPPILDFSTMRCKWKWLNCATVKHSLLSVVPVTVMAMVVVVAASVVVNVTIIWRRGIIIVARAAHIDANTDTCI
jgi:hypothetical protein